MGNAMGTLGEWTEQQAQLGGARRTTGYELVGGDFEPESDADLLTCTAERFEVRVGALYADWQAFLAWVAERRSRGEGYVGEEAEGTA